MAFLGLCWQAGCTGGPKDDPAPRPVGLSIATGPTEDVEERTPIPFTVHVVDSAGELVPTFDGTLNVRAWAGETDPATLAVTGGVASGSISFRLAGDNGVSFSAATLGTAEQVVYLTSFLPAKVPGAATGGAVLGEGTGWDSDGAWAPFVQPDGSGFRMWYASSSSGGAAHIGLARSTDGVTWTREPAPLVGPSVVASACHADGADEPTVFRRDEGSWVMLYRGTNAGRVHLCAATSSDGDVWAPYAGPAEDGSVLAKNADPESFDDLAITAALVVPMPDQTWRAIYSADGSGEIDTANVGEESLRGLFLAESTDGLAWTRVTDVGYLGALRISYAEAPSGNDWDAYAQYDPSLLAEPDGVLRMWCSGDSVGGRLIGYFASLDLTDWPVHVENFANPVSETLTRGTAPAFDAEGVDRPSVVQGADGLRRIYYTGVATDGVARIGLATVPR